MVAVSESAIDRVFQCYRLSIKQVYRVLFELNSARVKDLQYQYVQVSVTYTHFQQKIATHIPTVSLG